MNHLAEFGVVGQKKYAGVFMEEFLTELQGQKGVEAYKEMAENDDIIGALLFAVEMLIRQVTWNVEAQGNTKIDKEAARFVEECLDDMTDTWQDTLSEILSFLTFGWSYHEICYKRRMGRNKDDTLNSKYTDGLIGWKKLPIRSQETLFRWEYDENDNLTGMTQMAPPDYQMRTIPLEKALHFRTKSRKNNPEGKSILRNVYRSHYFKRRFQVIEGIGIERDLAGLPMLQPPEGSDIWNDTDPDMVKAAEDIANKHSSYIFYVDSPIPAKWISEHIGELITIVSEGQMKAINYLVQRSLELTESTNSTVEALAMAIRPIVGLNAPQALANLNYYNRIRENLLKSYPKMRASTAEKRARARALVYASRQHRSRAMVIARTELAFAYNRGAYFSIKQAQEQGFMGKTEKRSVSALDERVCRECKQLHGAFVGDDEFFTTKWGEKFIPPYHPNCRCGVEYIEMEK